MSIQLFILKEKVRDIYLQERHNSDDFAIVWCMALEWVLVFIDEIEENNIKK